MHMQRCRSTHCEHADALRPAGAPLMDCVLCAAPLRARMSPSTTSRLMFSFAAASLHVQLQLFIAVHDLSTYAELNLGGEGYAGHAHVRYTAGRCLQLGNKEAGLPG